MNYEGRLGLLFEARFPFADPVGFESFGPDPWSEKRKAHKSERVLSGLNKTNKYSFRTKKDLCLINLRMCCHDEL